MDSLITMENFTNETIDTSNLPRYETVALTKLHPNYWKEILISRGLVLLVLGIAVVLGVIFIEELTDYKGLVVSIYGLFVLVFFFFVAFLCCFSLFLLSLLTHSFGRGAKHKLSDIADAHQSRRVRHGIAPVQIRRPGRRHHCQSASVAKAL